LFVDTTTYITAYNARTSTSVRIFINFYHNILFYFNFFLNEIKLINAKKYETKHILLLYSNSKLYVLKKLN
jgi:hypothetical protein